MLKMSGMSIKTLSAIAMIAMVGSSMPAMAGITVTFDQIARVGDPVPGRETLNVVFNGRAFQRFGPGVFSRPCINDAGQVVFMARSSGATNFNFRSTLGIYLKTPGFPLQLIVDQSQNGFGNVASVGAPFAVPGRAADAVFTGGGMSQLAPLINNRGDILFVDTFSSPSEGGGQGIYVVRASDGQMIKVVDSLDTVPGLPGQTFNVGFFFSRDERLPISMNDQGQVVFLGRFRQPGSPFEDQGIYGVGVDGRPAGGGPIVRLADTTQTVFPGNETLPFRSLDFTSQPAINNNGTVIFAAGIGNPPPAFLFRGVFAIPVDGSAVTTTLARHGQVAPPLSDGAARAWFSIFAGHDINDAGQFMFSHFFGSGFGATNGLFSGDLSGIPLSVIADNAGGLSVPGQPLGTNFTGIATATMNESGQMGFYAGDNGPISNGQGLYAADLAGTPLAPIAHNDDVPPGRLPPARFIDFKGQSANINDLGNMAVATTGFDGVADSVFGLYFFDGCTQALERVVDDDTSLPAPPAGLGDIFVPPGCSGFPCERAIRIFAGRETRSGHYRSINNNDDIAFFNAFSTFNSGVYIAHVQTGGGGDLRIVCPTDVTLECTGPVDTSATVTGEPRVCSDNPVTVSSSDTVVTGCGNTQTITRTWTAVDDVTLASVSCDQTISLVDTTPPVITGVPLDANVDCNALPAPATPIATDDCDPNPQLILNEVQTAATCGGDIFLTRTWTAIDACGNMSEACQILTLGGTTAPLLNLPPNAIVDCGGDTSPAATGTAGATADCLGTATVTFTDSVSPGACGAQSVITRTWTATDTCANSASADQTITLVDSTGPVLTLPADATIECDADSSPNGTGSATAADACGGVVVLNFTDAVTASDLCGTGSQITRTWSAVDECNNVATADQIITVVDTTAPIVSGPANVTIECDSDTSPATTGMATATDGCDAAPMLSFSDTAAGACPTIITRTWTATDACGQTATAIQAITQQDSTPPNVACPGDISTSGGFGGTIVSFSSSATDTCDLNPVVTATATSGSIFPTGVTTVTASAADACGNSSAACSFDVLVSCFGVNRAKIGTKQARCEGIALIEFSSTTADGSTLISLFVPDENTNGNGNSNGSSESKLPASITVDDGVNGSQAVDTSCTTAIAIGDVFGPYTVSDLVQVFDDLDDDHGNEVEIRGSFDPAVPFDPPTSDIVFTIDDGAGHTASYTIPAGSFQMDGNPEKGKFKFEGNLGVMEVKAKFEKCKFKLKIKNATNTGQLLGTTMTIGLTVGPNVASDTLAMVDKHNHLKFKRAPKLNCCPECEGVASMQVTSDQGVLVFVPAAGQTKLASNTVVDDGVNGAMTIHTSCSQPLEVGDMFGAYTISEVVKIYGQE